MEEDGRTEEVGEQEESVDTGVANVLPHVSVEVGEVGEWEG